MQPYGLDFGEKEEFKKTDFLLDQGWPRRIPGPHLQGQDPPAALFGSSPQEPST